MKKYLSLMILLLLIIAACSNKTADKSNELAIDVHDEKQTPQSSYETIDLNEVEALQADGMTVLDVREVDEFAEGHIVNAVNHPLSELQAGDYSGLDKDTSYIVICRSGNRSIEASNILHEAGYDLKNVSEGMSTWQGEITK